MRHHRLLVATAVLVAATFVNAAEAGQRQRSPGHDRGDHQSSGGGSDSGGRAAAPRDHGNGGGGRGNGGDRGNPGDRGNGGNRPDGGPRSNGGGAPRESAPAPTTRSFTPSESEAAQVPNSGSAVRRYPNRADVTPRTNQPGTTASSQFGATSSTGARAIERRPPASVDSRSYTGNGTAYTGRVAIPRSGPAPQRRDGYYAYGGRTYSYRGRYYTYAPQYYYSPRYYTYRPYYYYRPNFITAFSFGYGPYGRGYFYYDSFYNANVFYPRTVVRYGEYGSYGYPTGSLRLDMEPRDAQVYIDGAYAGLVDEFDGVFQSLRLEAGQYHVEVVLPGFETLAFDVLIRPGEKTTYRGELLPERGPERP